MRKMRLHAPVTARPADRLLAADPQPAMHIFDGGEKSPQSSRSLAENLSGVGIYEDGPLAAESNDTGAAESARTVMAVGARP